MSLSKEQILRNMRSLDYLEGKGIVERRKRSIRGDNYFLVVGLGGTGCNALAETKRKLLRMIDAESVDKYVRFLAVDTAWNELTQYVEDKKVFTYAETLPLPVDGAQEAVESNGPETQTWLNPRLKDYSRAVFAPPPIGAGGRRQCGRVLLCQANASTLLNEKAAQAIRDLITANSGEQRTCNIIVLAGIAGGTGSGTVLDAGYILNQTLADFGTGSNGGSIGFVFLPPAVSATLVPDVPEGNVNGYAALKEIEYHMTMEDRHEWFDMAYGGFKVHQQNIFKSCFLVDGRGSTRLPPNPRKVSADAVSDCVMNIICPETKDAEAAGGGAGVAHNNIFSVIVDSARNTESFIRRNTVTAVPRESYYKYGATGFSELVVPTDLLTVYAANKVFQSMFEWFDRCKYANEDAAKAVLEEIGIYDPNVIRRQIRTKSKHTVLTNQRDIQVDTAQCGGEVLRDLKKQFKTVIDRMFTDYGPYYMINLTKEMRDAMVGIPVPRPLPNPLPGIPPSKRECAEYEQVQIIWDAFADRLGYLNNNTYDVFNSVIVELKKQLEDTAKILTQTHEVQQGNQRSFSWTPLDIGTAAKKIGLDYIENIFGEERTNEIIGRFKDHLLSMRESWEKEADGPFDASEAVRAFIREEFTEVLDLNLQDFCVKCFTENPEAVATVPSTEDPEKMVATPECKIAAANIARELQQRGNPLAQLRNIGSFSGSSKADFLILPSGTPELNQEILTHFSGCKPYNSPNGDSFTHFANYLTLPAYVFDWVHRSEKHYATSAGDEAVGLHMDEVTRSWPRLPNLIAQSKWDHGVTYPLEVQIAAHVDALMEKAKKWGLVNVDGEEISLYLLRDKPEKDKSETALSKALGKAKQPLGETDPEKQSVREALDIYQSVADDFYNRVSGNAPDPNNLRAALPNEFSEQETKPVCCLLNIGTTPPYDGWQWEFTKRFMRKMYDTCLSLQRTISVLELVRKRLEDIGTGSQYLDLFSEYYGLEFFTYDETCSTWVYDDENGVEQELLAVDNLKTPEQPYQLFYLFQEFCKLPDSLFEFWAEEAQAASEDKAKRSGKTQRKAALKPEIHAKWEATSRLAFKRSLNNPDLAKKINDFYREAERVF